MMTTAASPLSRQSVQSNAATCTNGSYLLCSIATIRCTAQKRLFWAVDAGFEQCVTGLHAAARKAGLSSPDMLELFNPVINVLGTADI